MIWQRQRPIVPPVPIGVRTEQSKPVTTTVPPPGPVKIVVGCPRCGEVPKGLHRDPDLRTVIYVPCGHPIEALTAEELDLKKAEDERSQLSMRR